MNKPDARVKAAVRILIGTCGRDRSYVAGKLALTVAGCSADEIERALALWREWKQVAVDIRERVARAICIECDESPDAPSATRAGEPRWRDYLPVADAAIAAMAKAEEPRKS
jgi:hypothetical protein